MLSPLPTFGSLALESRGRNHKADTTSLSNEQKLAVKLNQNATKGVAESISELLDMDVLRKLKVIFENSESGSNSLTEQEFTAALKSYIDRDNIAHI